MFKQTGSTFKFKQLSNKSFKLIVCFALVNIIFSQEGFSRPDSERSRFVSPTRRSPKIVAKTRVQLPQKGKVSPRKPLPVRARQTVVQNRRGAAAANKKRPIAPARAVSIKGRAARPPIDRAASRLKATARPAKEALPVQPQVDQLQILLQNARQQLENANRQLGLARTEADTLRTQNAKLNLRLTSLGSRIMNWLPLQGKDPGKEGYLRGLLQHYLAVRTAHALPNTPANQLVRTNAGTGLLTHLGKISVKNFEFKRYESNVAGKEESIEYQPFISEVMQTKPHFEGRTIRSRFLKNRVMLRSFLSLPGRTTKDFLDDPRPVSIAADYYTFKRKAPTGPIVPQTVVPDSEERSVFAMLLKGTDLALGVLLEPIW